MRGIRARDFGERAQFGNPNDATLSWALSISDGGQIHSLSTPDGPVDPELVSELEVIGRIAEYHRFQRTQNAPTSDSKPWGPLEILDLLGAGGFGEVYRAWDPGLEREVALKLLPEGSRKPSRRDSILNEGRLLARLRHRNVVTVFGIAEYSGRIGLWMELIQGQTLGSLVRERGPLGFREAAGIAADVCLALAAVHQAGLIHRDVKAENVMREEGGRIVLMDLGLGQSPVARGESSDPARALAGTPLYLAPEMFRGASASPQSDIYALGVLIYHLVSGSFPVVGEDLVQLAVRHQEGRRRLLHDVRPDLPREFVQVVERMLQPDPAKRFRSVGEILQGLEDSQVLAQTRSGQARRRQPPLVLTALLATLIVLVGGTTVFVATERSDLLSLLGLSETGTHTEPAAKHLVVLPFTNVGGDPSQQLLIDGLAETLTSKLTQMEGLQQSLWVVPFFEVAHLPNATVEDARKAFGINLAVTGSFQQVGTLARLTLNLVDARDLRQLRSSIIDLSKAGDLANQQDRVAAELARLVGLEVDPPELETALGSTVSAPRGYELYLEARGRLLRAKSIQDYQQTIDLFQQSLAEDPGFALAESGLAEAYWRTYKLTNDTTFASKADDASRRAVDLEKNLPETQVIRGMVQAGLGHPKSAVGILKQALQLDPRNADALRELARAYEELGDLTQAESTYRDAIKIRPEYWRNHDKLALFYFRNGRFDEAADEFRRVTELAPDNFNGYNSLGGCLFYLQKLDQAREMFERAIRLEPDVTTNDAAYSNLATLSFRNGDYRKAAELYSAILEVDPSDYLVWQNLANSWFWANEREKAGDAYRKAIRIIREQLQVQPLDPLLLSDLANDLSTVGATEEAVSTIRKALSLAPEDSRVNILAAETYATLGHEEAALRCIKIAVEKGYPPSEIQLDPTFAKFRERGLLEDLKSDSG